MEENKFIVIKSYDISEFVEEVNQKIKDGYDLAGPASSYSQESSYHGIKGFTTTYNVSMIKK